MADFVAAGREGAPYLMTFYRLDYTMDGKEQQRIGMFDIGSGDGTIVDNICHDAEYYRNNKKHQDSLSRLGAETKEKANAKLDFDAQVLVPFLERHCDFARDEAHAISELMGIYEKAGGQPSETDTPRIAHLESVVEHAGRCRELLNTTGFANLLEHPSPFFAALDAEARDAETAIKDGEIKYATGADFWKDAAASHGRDEAHIICGNYLAAQLQSAQPDTEKQFCRELFTAMYEDSLQSVNPVKLVYPYDFKTADDLLQGSLYHNSRKQSTECAKAIDETINKSCYEPNYYNLDLAAMKVIHDYGFERVNMVLARNIHDYDGRFSTANKQWARGYDVTSSVSPVAKAFNGAVMNAHPILIDSFTNHTKKLYQDLGAERHALPGVQETGTNVKGYDIVRSVQFDNDRGFAIGLNPHAVNQFVCWQFTAEQAADGTVARDFYWGNYFDEAADAALNYTARVISHMDGTDIKEVRRTYNSEHTDMFSGDTLQPLTKITGSTPQENKPLNRADEKPSVLKQIREARSAPKPVPKPKQEQEFDAKSKKKNQPDL